MRNWLRKTISKKTRHWLIEQFVKHKYWYNQGNSSLSVFDDMVPLAMITMGCAALKYILSDYIPLNIVYIVFGIFLVFRIFGKWYIGRFWHNNNGYDLETEWNKGKVPPSRVEVINTDEIVEKLIKRLKEEN